MTCSYTLPVFTEPVFTWKDLQREVAGLACA